MGGIFSITGNTYAHVVDDTTTAEQLAIHADAAAMRVARSANAWESFFRCDDFSIPSDTAYKVGVVLANLGAHLERHGTQIPQHVLARFPNDVAAHLERLHADRRCITLVARWQADGRLLYPDACLTAPANPKVQPLAATAARRRAIVLSE